MNQKLFIERLIKKEDRLCELCGNILVSYQERFCSRQCKADMEYLIYIAE